MGAGDAALGARTFRVVVIDEATQVMSPCSMSWPHRCSAQWKGKSNEVLHDCFCACTSQDLSVNNDPSSLIVVPHLFRFCFPLTLSLPPQATEPATLIPLTRGAQCVVMAGDPCQLPPTVVSRK